MRAAPRVSGLVRRRAAIGARQPDRFRVLLLLFGWALATGAHWDVIQVAAWGHMWMRNAQVQPLGLALATTFSPDGMCGVCQTVQAAKLNQDDDPVLDSRASGKAALLLPLLRCVVIEQPLPCGNVRRADAPPPPTRRAAPPVPPPRPARGLA